MASKPIKLTTTSYALLALLDQLGEGTSYDIKQALEKSIENFWNVPHTTAYEEPARLAEGGYLSVKQEAGGRRRKSYALTEEGRGALRAWADEPEASPPALRDEFVLKVFAGADPEPLAEARLAWHREKLEELSGYLEAVRAVAGYEGSERTLLTGLAYHRMMIEMIEELRPGRKLVGAMRRIAPALLAGIAVLSLLGIAQGEVVSGGNVRVSFRGWINPETLPRSKAAPIALHIAGTVKPVGGQRPAALESVTVEINRHGVVSTRGLPTCPRRRLESTTTDQALAICREALVGSGHFTSHVDIPDQAPFPSAGRMLAFNTTVHGRPALVAHVFGRNPVPTSQVLPMSFRRQGSGAFGSTLTVVMPSIGPDWGYVTGFDLTLERRYRHRGRELSLLSASCPAPKGIREAPFKAARGTYRLAGGETLTRVLSGTCEVGEP